MTKNDSSKSDTGARKPDAVRPESRAEEKTAPKIDFSKLDLTVEKVEERISPSETNVFDK
ncbi:MAG: hypothetical protein SGI72_06480 [Planctomycetota bacterium]|mgnify:CR=1 FL=1|nr:hypothetical protein [Planctomycetota bacterium]